MKKDVLEGAGLQTEVEATETKRAKRFRSAEENEVVKAGVEKLVELGVDENTAFVLQTLVPVWGTEDKDALAEAKQTVMEHFGGSDKFKDFVEGGFAEALKPFAGITKIIPIVNNIHSFYARRKSATKKTALVIVSIDGKYYEVSKEYHLSIANQPAETRRELLLAHEATREASVAAEVL